MVYRLERLFAGIPFSVFLFPFSGFLSPVSFLRFPFSGFRSPFSVLRSPFSPSLPLPFSVLLFPVNTQTLSGTSYADRFESDCKQWVNMRSGISIVPMCFFLCTYVLNIKTQQAHRLVYYRTILQIRGGHKGTPLHFQIFKPPNFQDPS